jgi:hypothetical protein
MYDALGGDDMGGDGIHNSANQQSRPHINMGGRTPGEGQCAGGPPVPRGFSGRGGAAGRGGRGAEGGREGERRRSAHDMQLFRHISDSESTGEICQLIEAHVAQFDPINVSMAFKKLLNSRRDGMPRGIHSRPPPPFTPPPHPPLPSLSLPLYLSRKPPCLSCALWSHLSLLW